MTRVEQAIERLRALPPADRESAADDILLLLDQYAASSKDITRGEISGIGDRLADTEEPNP